MVGNAPLRIIVGAYLGRTVAGRHHRFTFAGNVVDIFLVLFVIDESTETGERTLFVLGLVACFGTFDQNLLDFAVLGFFQLYRKRTPDSTLLTFCPPAPPLGMYPFDFTFVYLYVEWFGFGQYGDRRGRCMYPALRFCCRDTLHAVNSRFVFQRTVDFLSRLPSR